MFELEFDRLLRETKKYCTISMGGSGTVPGKAGKAAARRHYRGLTWLGRAPLAPLEG